MFVLESSCVYCSSPFNLCRDHVIPTSYLRQKRKYEGDWLVTSCQECNNVLGSDLIFNVPDRANRVLQVLRKKYLKVLNFPEWTPEELEELSHSFKASVISSLTHKHEIQERLNYLELVSKMPKMYKAEGRPSIIDEDCPDFI